MKKNRAVIQTFLLLASLSSLLLAACGGATAPSNPEERGQVVPVQEDGSYTDLTPAELNSLFEQQDPFFVNVHIPYEGEIPDTDAFVPYNEIDENKEIFPSDSDALIVVYCRSGSMSAIAAEELTRMGYSQVLNLDGGFRAWDEAGYPFIAP